MSFRWKDLFPAPVMSLVAPRNKNVMPTCLWNPKELKENFLPFFCQFCGEARGKLIENRITNRRSLILFRIIKALLQRYLQINKA